jgi:uncharacterized protein (DUF58 family)
MPSRNIPELQYRIGGSARGHFPGHHRSRHGTSGLEFRGHAALLDAPDARRLDLNASLRDPFGNWIVRVYSQRMSIPVVVVADLSASMGFEGAQRRLDVLADFVESLAWSAWRTGDSFGFVGCDSAVRSEFVLAPTRARGAGSLLAARLRGLQPEGRSAQGLRDAHRHLPRQRALVFLVSDFHLPLAELADVLASLAHHEVVPVVLWQPEEFGLVAATHGLVDAIDPETGQRRWLWWRPALRARWEAAHRQRRDDLLQVFRARRMAPLVFEGAFDAEAVTRHFHS